MEAFTTFEAVAVPIDIANCDTDQIIPGRFLKRPQNDNEYHRFLLHDLRYHSDGSEKPEFVLNQSKFRGARILVADINWGCGSSRENAVYALTANGFRCVIAPSFGDIHYNNCMKQGVLPVRLERSICDDLRRQLHDEPGAAVRVDLNAQIVQMPDGTTHAFEIGAFDKHRMVLGLDDIAMTERYEDAFERFERAHRRDFDWMFEPE
jgi:3-isopropylmalate/(R)-2-methylmalate dehydratase small subunit